MTTVLETSPATLRERCAELFDDELSPVLRRLGRHRAGPDDEDRELRAGVWAALADLGALAPAAGRTAGDRVALADVAELMGAALYPSPYAGTVTAAALADPGILAGITAGERTFALAWHPAGTADPAASGPEWTDGPLSGERRFVAFASEVDELVVPVADGVAFVPVDQPGVRLRRHGALGHGDLHAVTLAAAHARFVPADPASLLAGARVRHAAYLAGLARGALELAVARLKERSAFGGPLAKQQVLAHRVAALASRTAAVLAFARATARRPADDAGLPLAAAQALLLAAELARETATEAVHLHGAAGMTDRHDVSLYYRRAAVDVPALGTPRQLRRQAGALLAAAHRRNPSHR
ncbi:acyl-CoA dehydrogenase family protein [Amycolatopsis sp. NPDC047767]|uniref:acyl-CoA dehydrogenase family protein n=1 Tax=Amycolatopsis sp. NPDC047767 TaxID=3156765 RepID=UPI0034573944